MEKINASASTHGQRQMTVISKNRSWGDYIALAAAVTAILVTAWVVYYGFNGTIEKPAIAVVPEQPVAPEVQNVVDDSTAKQEVVASAVVEEILEETSNKSPVGIEMASIAMNNSDLAIALDLEDAGLLVLDMDDGLFDPFNL